MAAKAKTSTKPSKHPKARKRTKETLIALGVITLLLLAGRAYLPVWLTGYVNRTLDNVEGYQGSISDVDVALIRGAYQIYDLKLNKTGGGIPVPFLDIKTVDLSLQWGALLNGRIVSEVYLTQPTITFAQGAAEADKQTGGDTNWYEPIENLMPIDINVVDITNGTIAYRDFSVTPEVDLSIYQLDAQVTNLRNVQDANVVLPSIVKASGVTVGEGSFTLDGKLNILQPSPNSDVTVEVENVNLPALNSYFNSFAALDFAGGTLNLYSEIVTKDGHLTGYIKPLITEMDVVDLRQDKNPINIIWESLAAIVMEVFQNQPKDQFATKIPLDGNLENVQTEVLPTIGNIIYNAFVQAFSKGTDDEIRFENVEEGESNANTSSGGNASNNVQKSTDETGDTFNWPDQGRVLKR